MMDEQHHKYVTFFLHLEELDMVFDFLSDPMYFSYLGVDEETMRNLFYGEQYKNLVKDWPREWGWLLIA